MDMKDMKMDSKFEDDMMGETLEHKHKKYKSSEIMSMEDVGEQLSKDFVDEIADSKKYFHMAKIAEKADDYEDCHYLTEMAKDEYTHAYFIHSFMMEHGICIPAEQKEEFECLTDTMKDFFR